MSALNLKLKDLGILGINGRNLDYIFKSNPRRYYPLVDDKLKTKTLAQQLGIPTPELYAVIEFQEQVNRFEEIMAPYSEFAIKPAKGSGGGGIIVMTGRTPSGYIRGGGSVMHHSAVKYHLHNIMSGMYSLGGSTDKALIEYRIETSKVFNKIMFRGVPDIRVIIFKGVPAMAMLRLPTHESDGKANLHKGGIGVGIDMKTGTTLSGVHRNNVITMHPETGYPINGLQLPDWERLLHMTASFDTMLGLRYIGVDMVLDEFKGPLLLEVNARPGLAIQIANQQGLIPRLELIDKHADSLGSVADKVAFAREHFQVPLIPA
ncbi:MAG: alpha-L-glutamate ligase-like protein [Rickettsiales bacterium]